MDKSNFIDYIRVFCRSGHGGAGSKHFMRTKFNPQAGPDGGDGGRGGHIILKGNKNLWTLLHLRYYKNILAGNGEGGSGNNSTGRNGKDVVIEVPLGTVASRLRRAREHFRASVAEYESRRAHEREGR